MGKEVSAIRRLPISLSHHVAKRKDKGNEILIKGCVLGMLARNYVEI